MFAFNFYFQKKISFISFSFEFSIQCYIKILQLDPENIQGLHNLCVVYVERGLLAKAYACLNEAHKLAPSEDYIVKHIQIVESRLAKLKAQPSSTKEKDLAFSEFDPQEFGGRSFKQNMAHFNNLKSSQTDSEESKIVQTSKDPVFLDPHSSENFQKHEKLKRIQNNYATDLDDPSSGMS
jgi:protein O-mannosyl-transferase